MWERAAKHEHGGGLESGVPSVEAVRKAVKYLRRHGFSKEAKAFEFVMVGFYRDPLETDEPHTILCKQCATGARATRFHKTYIWPDLP